MRYILLLLLMAFMMSQFVSRVIRQQVLIFSGNLFDLKNKEKRDCYIHLVQIQIIIILSWNSSKVIISLFRIKNYEYNANLQFFLFSYFWSRHYEYRTLIKFLSLNFHCTICFVILLKICNLSSGLYFSDRNFTSC